MLRLLLLLAGLGGLLAPGSGKAAETLSHRVWADGGYSFPSFEEYLLPSNGGPTRLKSPR